MRNYGITVRVARYHNIFGPEGSWENGKEKAPAAMCRKVAECSGEHIEVWGDGKQTRSFLYIDECIEATLRFMRNENFTGPVNIGSEEMVTINQLANLAISFSGKDLTIKNISGPTGVRGRNSDNKLYKEKIGWEPSQSLKDGLKITYNWISEQVNKRGK
jgi:nucleoside-diphosphate-sugar epimerase